MENTVIETPDIESSSASYARRFSGPVGAYFLQVQRNAVARLLHLDVAAPGANGSRSLPSVLDVGGGHAQLTPFLTAAGCPVTVLGSDGHGREQLDLVLGDGDYHYDTGNLLDLPYADGAFDVVIAIRLLPHLVNWDKFVSELCRVARFTVIVDYPEKRSANYFADSLFNAKKAIEKDTRPYTCFSSREIGVVFEKYGYAGGDMVKQFAVPMAFHRAVGNRWVSATLERLMGVLGLRQLFGSPVIRAFSRTTSIQDR